MNNKFYWLKLKSDFFKRHDIRIVEAMPNGKDYILFYLKMLLESISHNGELRFSETIPYDENMLATITNTNIDIVRSAMKVFMELDMIEMMDDQTIYMTEVNKMIGSAADNDNANRQRRFREKKKAEGLPSVMKRNGNVTGNNAGVTKNNENKNIEIDIEKEIDIDIEKNKQKRARFVSPSLEEVKAYCEEIGSNIDADYFYDYYTSNGWMAGKNHMKDWKATIRNWNRRNASGNSTRQEQTYVNPFTELKREEGLI